MKNEKETNNFLRIISYTFLSVFNILFWWFLSTFYQFYNFDAICFLCAFIVFCGLLALFLINLGDV